MTALEGGDLSSMDDVMYLLGMVLPHIPAAPVRAKFRHIAGIMVTIGRQLDARPAGTKNKLDITLRVV